MPAAKGSARTALAPIIFVIDSIFRWIWQHSVVDTNYTNWATDYPDYTNAEDDCVVMASRDSFMWSNTDCGGLAACPVCQRGAEWSDGTTTVDQASTTTQESKHLFLRTQINL